MKNVILRLTFILCFLLIVETFTLHASTEKDSQQAEGSFNKRYPIESCLIEYKVSGVTEGTILTYFSKWGARQLTRDETQTTVLGKTFETNDMMILDEDIAYIIKLNKKIIF